MASDPQDRFPGWRRVGGTDAAPTLVGAAPAAAGPAIVIRVNDVGGLIKSQSAAGGVLFSITPETMSNLVYSQMKDKLAAGLAEQGVNADVQIVASPPSGPAPKSEFLRGAAIGAGAIGACWALWSFVLRGLFTKGRR